MIVRCENCQTEFALDEAQVPAEGVTVRCSVCAHVFRVDASAAGAVDQPWQIRTTDDLLFTAPDVATLKQWIDEGRLHPDDQVSRTGNAWLRIGDMPELAASFSGVAGVPNVVTSVAEPLEPDSERSAVEALGPPPSFGGSSAPPIGSFAPPGAAEEPQRSITVPWAPKIEPSASPPPRPGSESGSNEAAARAAQAAQAAQTARQAERAEVEPGSPLSAVTQHAAKVRPITSPPAAEGSEPMRARPAAAEPPPTPTKAPPTATAAKKKRAVPAPETDTFDVDLDDEPFESPRRRRAIWPIFAVLGLAGGVALVFGHPDVRAYVLGPSTPATDEAGTGAEEWVGQAATALSHMSLNEVARAEASLQRAIDRGGSDAGLDRMRLAQSELLIHRALLLRMGAQLAPDKADGYRERAKDDIARAGKLLEQIGEGAQADHLSAVRAKLRLADARGEAEILALLSPDDESTRLLVRGAPLWRDPEAPVPEGVLEGLQAMQERDGLGEALLILALVRSGDQSAAKVEATRVLVTADDHPVAKAIAGGVESDAQAAGDTDGDTDGAGETGGADEQEPESKASGDDGGGTKRGGGGGGGGGVAGLIDKGCRQVESGSASAGVSTLLRAFDRAPNDLDVLVCLGKGYANMGNLNRADHFLGRALKKSPRHRIALKASAGVAAKRGRTDSAVKLYEKVLEVSPSDATAKAYVAKHGTPKPAPSPGGGAQPGEGGTPTPAPTTGQTP